MSTSGQAGDEPPQLAQGDTPDLASIQIASLFDDEEQDRILKAASSRIESPAAFLRDAILDRVADVIGEDGHLECWVDDCEETFTSERRRRGHVGRVHSDNLPEGEFWCGICGYGPTTYPGIGAHHGQRHDHEDVRPLDHEPDRDELLAPDDIPDHMDRELLERLYHENGGSITGMCRSYDFEVTQGRVRHYLIEFGIHEPTPQGEGGDEHPVYRDRDWLKERYDAAGGNLAEMHRNLEIDIPYRTLVNTVKRFDFHDPTDPPGKRHGKGGPKPSTPAKPEDETQEADIGEDPVEEDLDPVGEPDDRSPPIEWDFESGFTTVAERDDRSSDRVVEGGFCRKCGAVFDGDGLCESCEEGLEEELITDGGAVECDYCGKLHHDRESALKCCSERFETDGGRQSTVELLSTFEAAAEGYPEEVIAPVVDVELELPERDNELATDGGSDEPTKADLLREIRDFLDIHEGYRGSGSLRTPTLKKAATALDLIPRSSRPQNRSLLRRELGLVDGSATAGEMTGAFRKAELVALRNAIQEAAAEEEELATDGGRDRPRCPGCLMPYRTDDEPFCDCGRLRPAVMGELLSDPRAGREDELVTDGGEIDLNQAHLKLVSEHGAPVGYDGSEEPPFGREENGRPLGPDCPECGESMEAGSFGHAGHTGWTVDWADCEDCGIGWGPFTGFVDLDESDDEETVVTDGGRDINGLGSVTVDEENEQLNVTTRRNGVTVSVTVPIDAEARCIVDALGAAEDRVRNELTYRKLSSGAIDVNDRDREDQEDVEPVRDETKYGHLLGNRQVRPDGGRVAVDDPDFDTDPLVSVREVVVRDGPRGHDLGVRYVSEFEGDSLKLHGTGFLWSEACREIKERIHLDSQQPGTLLATVIIDADRSDYRILWPSQFGGGETRSETGHASALLRRLKAAVGLRGGGRRA